MSSGGVGVARLDDGLLARVVLDAGKGNVITVAVIRRLDEVMRELGEDRCVRAVVLTAEGKDFSFGASVEEHAPGEVDKMLPAFHQLFRTIASASVPICAAVRGRCLGGGLELVLASQRIVVARDAQLGVPEVTLGVFPPPASALLPLRVAQPTVDRLVGLGDIVSGEEAVALGLADEAVETQRVEEQALAWVRRYEKLSGVAVRFATRAARAAWNEALGERLARLEKMYLRELMQTEDAREGIAAFMEKRKPVWRDQ